jgi:hypothetical protein
MSCVEASKDAAILVSCGEDEIACIASGFSIAMPENGTKAEIACAENAVQCAAKSLQLSELDACADKLTACALASTLAIF